MATFAPPLCIIKRIESDQKSNLLSLFLIVLSCLTHRNPHSLSSPKFFSEMADLGNLSAEEREIIEALRKKKSEPSVSKTQSPSKSIIAISEREEEVEASSS